MADTLLLTDNFALGRVTDVSPDRMKPNAANVMDNLIPDRLNAPTSIRGAWTYIYTAHADFTFFSASSTKITAVGFMPFTDGARVCGVDQSGRIVQINGSGVGALLDATGLAESGGIPFWHRDRMILPGTSGTKYPWQITSDGAGNSTAAAASGNFPKAKHGASWQGVYLLLSNGGDPFDSYNLKPRRTWISDPAAITFTSGSSFDWPDEILRTIPLNAGIMGFGTREIWLCTGTNPPGVASSNMRVEHLYAQGTSDGKSVTRWRGYAVWANPEGIWMSDSTLPVNLTQDCGLSLGWQTDMQNFGTGWTLAGGMFGNYYVVTACNSGGTAQFTYVIDIARKVGFNFKGIPAVMYAEVEQASAPMSTVSTDDLLFASSGVAQVGRLQPCFATGTSAGKDANGTVIAFQLVTGLYRMGTPAEKRFRRLLLSHDTDVSSPYTDTPEIAYTVTNAPLSGVGASMTSLTFPATGSGRQVVQVNDRGRWIAFRIRNNQSGTAGTKAMYLFALELEGHVLEKSKSDTT